MRAKNQESGGNPCCPSKPALGARELVSASQASGLSDLFKLLGNETRVRLVHALVRAGELRVTELSKAVRMKPQAVSNQLQRLANRGVVASRRDGTNIHYRLVDPCVAEIFDRALCLLEDAESGAHMGRR